MFPLPPTSPYPLGGATLATRLAASRDYRHPRRALRLLLLLVLLSLLVLLHY